MIFLMLSITPTYSKTPFLDLPQAIEYSCAVVRGHAIKLATSDLNDEVWQINVIEIYDWNAFIGPPSSEGGRVLFLLPSIADMSGGTEYKDVILFLTCCGSSVFGRTGPTVRVYSQEDHGKLSYFIRDWGALGVGQGKEIPLEDFKQMISKEVARQKKCKRK